MVGSHAWTDTNESDPGVTMLELLAFLASGYMVMNGLGPLLEKTGLARLETTVSVDGEPWAQVGDLGTSGADAKVFRLDSINRKVEFGDGERGRAPSGSVETSSSYRYGAGAIGLVGLIAVVCGLWTVSIWRRWRRSRKVHADRDRR